MTLTFRYDVLASNVIVIEVYDTIDRVFVQIFMIIKKLLQ